MSQDVADKPVLPQPQILWPGCDREECDDDEDAVPCLCTSVVLTAVSPDQRLLLLGDGAEWHHNGGDIGLWDVQRGRWRARLLSGLDYHGEAYCGIFSPDSARVFVAPVEDMQTGCVIAWSTAGCELWRRDLGAEPEEPAHDDSPCQCESVRLAVSGDGRLLAALSLMRNQVVLLDAETGAVRAEVDIQGRHICGGVALDADGERLALGQRGGDVLVLRLDGSVAWDGPAGVGPVDGLAFAPDGQSLVVAGNGARLLPLAGPAAPVIDGHPDDDEDHPSVCVAYGPAGPRALLYDKRVARVVDVRSGAPLLELPLPFESVAFSRDGELLVTSTLEGAKAWPLRTA